MQRERLKVAVIKLLPVDPGFVSDRLIKWKDRVTQGVSDGLSFFESERTACDELVAACDQRLSEHLDVVRDKERELQTQSE